jgi:hypothetical protein
MNKEFIKELVGGILLFTLVIACAWLYCKATPNQYTGESDWTAECAQMRR